RRVRAIGSQPFKVSTPRLVADPEVLRGVAEACRYARRGLIVCGPAPSMQMAGRAAIHALAAATGFPLVPGATSQLRFAAFAPNVLVLDAFEPLVRSARFRSRYEPDFVIQIGRPPTSTGWEQLLNTRNIPRVVFARHGWNDPHSSASTFVFADVGQAVQG